MSDSWLLMCCLRLLTPLLPEKPSTDELWTTACTDAAFILALTWSFGCTSGDSTWREAFDSFLRQEVGDGKCSPPTVSGIPQVDCLLLPQQSVFDVFYDPEHHAWVPWMEKLQATPADVSSSMLGDVFIPTLEYIRCNFLLSAAVRQKFPILLTGPPGTGKTMFISRFIELDITPESWAQVKLVMRTSTTAATVQAQLEGALEKRCKVQHGPALRKHGILFIDDINMAAKDISGAQPPLELLRQAIVEGGWFGNDNKFRPVQSMTVVAAMNSRSLSQVASSDLPDSYLRLFNMVSLPEVRPQLSM
eukprot:jgi/Botrbrau1/8168/Bobra.357_2s0014.1